jgi:hypothetical protein
MCLKRGNHVLKRDKIAAADVSPLMIPAGGMNFCRAKGAKAAKSVGLAYL